MRASLCQSVTIFFNNEPQFYACSCLKHDPKQCLNSCHIEYHLSEPTLSLRDLTSASYCWLRSDCCCSNDSRSARKSFSCKKQGHVLGNIGKKHEQIADFEEWTVVQLSIMIIYNSTWSILIQ